ARFTPESSPRKRTKPKRSSTARFNRFEISLIVSGAALSPACPFATSPAAGKASSSSKEGPGMNILLVGSGGREHALAWKLAQSRLITEDGGTLYAAPGNPGIAQHALLVELDLTDHAGVVAFCGSKRVGL